MRKGWKIFWIICASAAGIGFVCCILAVILGFQMEMVAERFPYGIGITAHNGEGGEHVWYGEPDITESFSGIHEIDAELSAVNVQVLETEEENIRLETTGLDSRNKFTYYEKEGELKLNTNKKMPRISGLKSPGTVYLYIPKHMILEKAGFKIGAGELVIQNISANKLDVKIGAGSADIQNFRAEEAEMECGAGEIVAAGDAAQKLDINCSVGNVEMTVGESKASYNYELSCGVGNIDLEGASFSGLVRKKKINNYAGRNMDIKCGVGNVSIQFFN